MSGAGDLPGLYIRYDPPLTLTARTMSLVERNHHKDSDLKEVKLSPTKSIYTVGAYQATLLHAESDAEQQRQWWKDLTQESRQSFVGQGLQLFKHRSDTIFTGRNS